MPLNDAFKMFSYFQPFLKQFFPGTNIYISKVIEHF